MNKKLRFDSKLVPLILSGTKTSTWRLWDDKNLTTGDVVDFFDGDSPEKFVTVKLIKVIEKLFSELTKEDKKGHEKFTNDEMMFKSFEKYYNQKVDSETLVKIIQFAIL